MEQQRPEGWREDAGDRAGRVGGCPGSSAAKPTDEHAEQDQQGEDRVHGDGADPVALDPLEVQVAAGAVVHHQQPPPEQVTRAAQRALSAERHAGGARRSSASRARTRHGPLLRNVSGRYVARACATRSSWWATRVSCSPRTATVTPTRARAWSGTRPGTTTPDEQVACTCDRGAAGRPHPRRPAEPAVLDVGRRDGRQRARRGHRQRGGLHQPARGRRRPAGHGPAAPGPGTGDHGRTRPCRSWSSCSSAMARAAAAATRTRASRTTTASWWPTARRPSCSRRPGSKWATEAVTHGARSISNGLTIPELRRRPQRHAADPGVGLPAPPGDHPGPGRGRHRSRGADDPPAGPRSGPLGAPLRLAQRRHGGALHARRRRVGQLPDDGQLGRRPPPRRPALGHRDRGAVHGPVQAGDRRRRRSTSVRSRATPTTAASGGATSTCTAEP